MIDRWFTARRRERKSNVSKCRPGRGLEALEPRAMFAAQPVSAVAWISEALDTVPVSSLAAANSALLASATSLTDDRYEQNDTFAKASNLGTITSARTVSQLVMADKADWYRFTISSTGVTSDNVSVDFTHANGDLDLALYNSRGRRIGLSDGVQSHEQVSLNKLAAGTYYVVVYGYRSATNPDYSLSINVGAGASSSGGSGGSSGGSTGGGTSTGAFQIDFNFSGLTASQQAAFQQAADKWESIIVGDLPNATYNGRTIDDLLIDAKATSIDGVGNVLGQAGPDRFRNSSLLPYHGSMEFDSADLASMEADGTLVGVITHEIGHVLGIGTLWNAKGLIAGAGTSNPRYIGPNAVSAYNSVFQTSVTGVPVENSGGSGTRDAHWKESVFGNEIMTGYVGPGLSLPVSRITVASLADLGYSVNLAAADAYTPPAGSMGNFIQNNGTTNGSAGLVQPTSSSSLVSSATQAWHRTLPISPRAIDWLFGRGWMA